MGGELSRKKKTKAEVEQVEGAPSAITVTDEGRSEKLTKERPDIRERSQTENALLSMIPKQGITFWIDSSDKESLVTDRKGSVAQWSSHNTVGAPIVLSPKRVRHRVKANVKSESPFVCDDNEIFGKKGIQTDYLHTFRIEPRLATVRTIVSLHCFNQKLRHRDVFTTGQDRGTWCNFYLFCCSNFNRYYFHTDANVNNQHSKWKTDSPLVSGNAAAAFRNSKVSLDGADFKPLSQIKFWTEPQIAIVECESTMNNLQIDQIGAERQCHHFSGLIWEIIVYDRPLTQTEIADIQSYFCVKYYAPMINVIETSLVKLGVSVDLVSILLSYLMPVKAARKFIGSNKPDFWIF